MTRLFVQCLALLALAFAAVLGVQGIAEAYNRHGAPLDAASVGALAPAVPRAAVPVLEIGPLSAFPMTSRLPVFFERREYPVRTKGSAKSQATTSPLATDFAAIKLHGIIMSGKAATAFIEIGQNAPAWVAVGDTIDGWKLQSIGSDRVALVNGLETASLELYKGKRR